MGREEQSRPLFYYLARVRHFSGSPSHLTKEERLFSHSSALEAALFLMHQDCSRPCDVPQAGGKLMKMDVPPLFTGGHSGTGQESITTSDNYSSQEKHFHNTSVSLEPFNIYPNLSAVLCLHSQINQIL